MKIPEIRPISDLARDAKGLIELAREKQEPIVITQRGRDVAVLLPVELYRTLEAALAYRLPPRAVLLNPKDAERFKMTVTESEVDAGLPG